MRHVLAGFLACVLLAACTSTATEAVPVPTTATIASATTTTAVPTATTAPTTTTTVIGAGLLDGELAAAWNRGDLDAYWSFFAPEALWNGDRRNHELDRELNWLVGVGWTCVSADCDRASSNHATCSAVFADDLDRLAGAQFTLAEDYWFDEAGYITSFTVRELSETPGADELYDAFDDWLADGGWGFSVYQEERDPEDRSIDDFHAAIALFPRFIEETSLRRLGDDPDIPEPILTGSVDAIDVFNASSRQRALVAWALTRFAANGVERPPVTAVRFPPTEACIADFSGVTTHADGGSTIDVCVEAEELAIASGLPRNARRTILHELGHVWNTHIATDPARQAFLDLRGLSAWNAAVWEESGSEQAAEIIMWGLMDEDVLPRVPDATCADRRAAFEALTGVPPIHRLEDCNDEPVDYSGSG